MSQPEVTSQWLTIYYHLEIYDRKHRESCLSCQTAFNGMGLVVDIIREAEEFEK